MEKITERILFDYLNTKYSDAKCALNYNSDYELLIAIILSAQTTDKAVNLVTPILFNKYKDINSLGGACITDVENIIKRIGLYKAKAKNIIECCKKLSNDGFDYIPKDFDYLISLSGVGRKTSNVFLAEYYHTDNLGIDTHIHRICKRLNITKSDTPLGCEKDLSNFLKYEPKIDAHHKLIAFGRNECSAGNPKCETCGLKKYCNKK